MIKKLFFYILRIPKAIITFPFVLHAERKWLREECQHFRIEIEGIKHDLAEVDSILKKQSYLIQALSSIQYDISSNMQILFSDTPVEPDSQEDLSSLILFDLLNDDEFIN